MLVKSEWHQVERRYGIEFDEAVLSEIYSDLNEEQIAQKLKDIIAGEISIEEVISEAWDNDIELDWDWLDEDDWWTDRKGGYDVTYAVDPERTYTSTVYNWDDDEQGPSTSDLETALVELKEEFDKLVTEQENVESKPLMITIHPAGEYKIELSGRTIDAGIGSMTQEQYDYWKDRDEDELSEALNSNFDYEENETPKECQLYDYYNEYEDIKFVWGVELELCYLEITNKAGEKIYAGPAQDFLDTAHGDDDSKYDATEETDECYIDYEAKDKGPVVYWRHGGKGSWYTGIIEAETELDLKKIKFNTCDWEGIELITEVVYNSEEIYNDGGDYWGKWTEYSVHDIK